MDIDIMFLFGWILVLMSFASSVMSCGVSHDHSTHKHRQFEWDENEDPAFDVEDRFNPFRSPRSSQGDTEEKSKTVKDKPPFSEWEVC